MPPVDQQKTVAEEKLTAEKEAAVSGAQAVADAVGKVAQAAVDQARGVRTREAPRDLTITGTPGGTFHLRSTATHASGGFSTGGSVLIGGKAQQTYEWGALYIRGRLDPDVQSGEVVVQIDAQTRRTGYLRV